MQNNPSDEILVMRTLDGDPAAFRMLVSRYQDLVFTIVMRIVGIREDAEEVAQDVFLKVYSKLHSWQGSAKFSTWLYRIAYNTALTKLRNHRTAAMPIDERSADAITRHTAAVQNDADRTFRAEDVSGAIALLAPDDAAIITLFYLAEQSIDEIAQTLDIEPNTAKVRLHRARKKLKEKMEIYRLN